MPGAASQSHPRALELIPCTQVIREGLLEEVMGKPGLEGGVGDCWIFRVGEASQDGDPRPGMAVTSPQPSELPAPTGTCQRGTV